MNRIAKTVMLVALFLIVTVSPSWSIDVGDPLPDFVLQTFDGNNTSRSTLEGKPALLVFWNTWCPNCKRELPEINQISKEYGPNGLEVIAINTAINDSEAKARAYWKEYGYGFPVGYDDDFEIGQVFGVFGVPTIFLVDSKGIVRYKQAKVPGDMGERLKQLNVGKN